MHTRRIAFEDGVSNPVMPASIVDQGLVNALGSSSVSLVFNKGRWVPLEVVQPSNVTVWLRGDAQIDTDADDIADLIWLGAPLLVSRQYGSGRIAYTTFHTHQQVNAEMTAIGR